MSNLQQLQSQTIQNAKIEFLRSLQPHNNTVYGVKSRARDMDPSMQQIFSWGYEAPVKTDYTKNKANLSNKIRKMGNTYISEAQDNYRKPEQAGDS